MIAQEILLNTFKALPNSFKSHQFYAKLRDAGIDEKELRGGTVSQFLSKVAVQPYFRARKWEKRGDLKTPTPKPIQPVIPFNPIHEKIVAAEPEPFPLTESEAIAFLKERGFKIFKYTEL